MSDSASLVALALEHVASGDLASAKRCLESGSDGEKVWNTARRTVFKKANAKNDGERWLDRYCFFN